MTEPVYSPDGKFMWTGSEWIPAPPAETGQEQAGGNEISMQDSVIGGDVVHNTSTVINNDAAAVTSAVLVALKEMGLVGGGEATPAPAVAPPTPEVELPPSFKVGDHVEYHSPTNNRWLDRCTVVGINDDGTYRVEVPKDNLIETKHAVVIGSAPGTIRPAASPFREGDRVLVNWKNYGNYYPGIVAKEHDDHTFLIHFDDGDVEDNVDWGRIEALQEESAEVQDYLKNVVEAERELIEAFQEFDVNGSGTISAAKFFEILTEMGDDPLESKEVIDTFIDLGIQLDSEVDYRQIAKWMLSSEDGETVQQKIEVVIRDAEIADGSLRGYAYAHPKLGEGPVRTSSILGITYDARATARVETRNTIYVVGPTGWKVRPADHPFNNPYSAGQKVQVEWNGSWFDASILAVNGDQYHITYDGYDSSWDEWVGTDRIKV